MTGAEAASLAEGVRASLATLKDIGGVTGSFVCTQGGTLVAREIPALFADDILAEAGGRLARLGETFAAGGDELDMAVARFGDHRLYLKCLAGGVLCIMITGTVNMPALRMAANLVGRRIAPVVARAESDLALNVTAGAHQPPPSAAPPPQGLPGMRRLRGHDGV